MGYDLALDSLYRLSDEEFRAIPDCVPEEVVVGQDRKLTKMASAEQRWLYDLCWAISPTKEDSAFQRMPWPQYNPLKAIKKGGEAFLILAEDRWTKQQIMLKIPLPHFRHDAAAIVNEIEETKPEPAQIVKDAKGMLDVGKSLFRRLEPPLRRKKKERAAEMEAKNKYEEEQKKKDLSELARSIQYEKAHRAYIIQEVAHRAGNKFDIDRRYGYVPKTLAFGFHPRCFFAQEYVPGQDFLEYIRVHSDEENYQLFLRLVIYLEKAVHARNIAHCDLHPRNILVIKNTLVGAKKEYERDIPVPLDFGASKSESFPEITLPGTVQGTIDFGSPTQLTDARFRGFGDDIFTFGRLLWCTILRQKPAGMVPAKRDKNGRLIYDEELQKLIADLYDPNALPAKYRQVFLASQELDPAKGYKSISDFRADLEGLMFPDRRVAAPEDETTKKIDALIRAYKKQQEQIEAIKKEISKNKNCEKSMEIEAKLNKIFELFGDVK